MYFYLHVLLFRMKKLVLELVKISSERLQACPLVVCACVCLCASKKLGEGNFLKNSITFLILNSFLWNTKLSGSCWYCQKGKRIGIPLFQCCNNFPLFHLKIGCQNIWKSFCSFLCVRIFFILYCFNIFVLNITIWNQAKKIPKFFPLTVKTAFEFLPDKTISVLKLINARKLLFVRGYIYMCLLKKNPQKWRQKRIWTGFCSINVSIMNPRGATSHTHTHT